MHTLYTYVSTGLFSGKENFETLQKFRQHIYIAHSEW